MQYLAWLEMQIIKIAVKIGHLFTYRDVFECSDVNALHGVILDRKCAIDRLHGCSVNPGDRAL